MTETEAKTTPEEALKKVKMAFPPGRNEFAKYFDLFHDGTHFRVNLHDADTNVVVRSYFVEFKDGELSVR